MRKHGRSIVYRPSFSIGGAEGGTCNSMKSKQHSGRDHSQLFLVRVWREESKAGSEMSERAIEWCGWLQDVVSGEWAYFEGLSGPTGLPAALEVMISREQVLRGSEGSKGAEER
jgi:hypothetical protein